MITAGLKKLKVLAVCLALAAVWMLGSLKAELDQPVNAGVHVDPIFVHEAFMASAKYNTGSHHPSPRHAADHPSRYAG